MRLSYILALLAISVALTATAAAQDPQPEAAPQPEAGDYTTRGDLIPEKRDLAWQQWIPGLAGKDQSARDFNKERLVQLGLPVVRELVEALDTYTLLPKLKAAKRVAVMRALIEDDLNAWYNRHGAQFKKLGDINSLVTKFGAASSDEDIVKAIQAFADTVKKNNEPVPPPQVLNSIRAYAAVAIGEVGDATADGKVAALLDDDSPEVQMHAVEALGKMRAPLSHAEKMYPFLLNDSVMARSKAWTALREMDARMAVDKLIAELGKAGDDLKRRDVIVQSLQGLTMQTFGPQVGMWRKWWDGARGAENPLQIEHPRLAEQNK